jgi:Insertion domain in 60S ribosomal protein L10P/Ribosomal protein L10
VPLILGVCLLLSCGARHFAVLCPAALLRADRVLACLWVRGRFFLGKNKVMCLAMGREKESEYKQNLHKISEQLSGECGLLFSDLDLAEVQKILGDFVKDDFARSGFKATEDVVLPVGPLLQFPFSMETHLRKLGMPTELKKGTLSWCAYTRACGSCMCLCMRCNAATVWPWGCAAHLLCVCVCVWCTHVRAPVCVA